MNSLRTLTFFSVLLLLAGSAPVSAAGSSTASPSLASASPPIILAERVSWSGFVKYWRNFVKNTDRVLLVVALVAGAALFIITRGRWLK